MPFFLYVARPPPFCNPAHQAVEAALEEKRAWLVQLEGQSQALSGYVTPGEAGHIRARLGQMGRGLEEFRGSVRQLIGQLQQSASHRQRYSDNLEQVRNDPIQHLDPITPMIGPLCVLKKCLVFIVC